MSACRYVTTVRVDLMIPKLNQFCGSDIIGFLFLVLTSNYNLQLLPDKSETDNIE